MFRFFLTSIGISLKYAIDICIDRLIDYLIFMINSSSKLNVRHEGCAQSNISLNVDSLIMAILPLFSLVTLTQELPILKYINRVLAFLILGLILYSLLSSGMDKWKYSLLSVYISVLTISACLTHWTSQVLAAAPRGLFFVTLLLYFTSKHSFICQYLVKNYRYLSWITFIWNLLILVSIPMPSSWAVQWGGARYFSSFVRSAFQLMPTAMLAMALNLILLKVDGKAIKALLYSILPLYAGLQGGSRTYFVLICIMALLVLLNCRLSKGQIFVLVFLISALVIWQFASSGIASKMANVTSVEQRDYSGMGFLGTLTSGRSEFWLYDLQAFFKLNPLQQFVGNGFSFSFDTNLESVGNYIFAHDDFINILMESGYIGLIVYFLSVGQFLASVSNKIVGHQYFLLVFIWLFNAFVNSFYTYTSSVIAWGLTAFALSMVPMRVGKVFKDE